MSLQNTLTSLKPSILFPFRLFLAYETSLARLQLLSVPHNLHWWFTVEAEGLPLHTVLLPLGHNTN